MNKIVEPTNLNKGQENMTSSKPSKVEDERQVMIKTPSTKHYMESFIMIWNFLSVKFKNSVTKLSEIRLCLDMNAT